jgi:glycoside/pentoside/hexuronide:cation symporter, GPH family
VNLHLVFWDVSIPVLFSGLGHPETWGFESLVSWFNGTGQIASLVGVVLVPFYANRVGRKAAFVSIFLVAIVSTGAFYFLKPDQVPLLFGVNLLGSITGGPLSALLWAMYADTADYAEWKKGRRATGLVFSASIFSQKQGWAIGAWVSLGLMSSVGFHANVAQNAETLHGLRLLFGLIPAVIGILSVIILLFYPLNETRMKEICDDLKARRAAELETPAPAAT